VTRGKKYRLRLINTSAEAVQRFAIDGHNLTVIANDFVPLVPYTAEVITLGVGQRADVILEASSAYAADSAFWLRSNTSCSLSLPGQKRAQAALYYEDADTGALPSSAATPYDDSAQLGNDDLELTEPAFALPVVGEPDVTLNITIGVAQNASNVTLFYMNNSSFRADYNDPLLLEAQQGHTSFPSDPQWNVHNTGDARTVRIILDANVSIAHPMHLHGHDFYVLAQGSGTWDGNITRPNNPQRRDVQLLPKLGSSAEGDRPYLVLQFDQDNPGVWPFHCHIAWHVSAGLYINIIERPDDIKQLQIPEIMAQTCRAWWDYTGHNVVDEIDSGL
jgi:FtsP/CotA-like multicopper oxidase with cupredoxin domain